MDDLESKIAEAQAIEDDPDAVYQSTYTVTRFGKTVTITEGKNDE